MPIPQIPPSAQATLDAMGDAVLSIDRAGIVIYLNAAAEALSGWTRAAAVGQPAEAVFRVVNATTRARVASPLILAMARNAVGGIPTDSVLVTRDGRDMPIEDSTAPIHDEAGSVIGAVVVFRHVGPALARAVDLAHAAMHDPLTHLPNRLLLMDRLTTAIALRARRDRPLGVCFIDVDGFKDVNDTLGHAVGDRLLQAISARLLAVVRHSDTVSRYGGDEFVIVLSEMTGAVNIDGIASTLLQACAGPHHIDDRDVTVTASLGVALYPRDGGDAATLIANADRAMYRAKQTGPGRYRMLDAATARALSAAEPRYGGSPRRAARAGADGASGGR